MARSSAAMDRMIIKKTIIFLRGTTCFISKIRTEEQKKYVMWVTLYILSIYEIVRKELKNRRSMLCG